MHEIAIMQHSQSFAEEGGGKGKIPGYSTIFSLEPVSFENWLYVIVNIKFCMAQKKE